MPFILLSRYFDINVEIILTFLFFTALIWQLMRAYTLSILTQLANTGSPIVEKEIVTWVNAKLAQANKKSSLKNFQVSLVKCKYLKQVFNKFV